MIIEPNVALDFWLFNKGLILLQVDVWYVLQKEHEAKDIKQSYFHEALAKV